MSRSTLSAWSPNGFRFFCMALAVSVLTVETIKSVVDLIPGELVNFVVYNAYGFICFNCCLYMGRSIFSRKMMWFINGFLASAVFMLWYASQFDTGDQTLLPIVYTIELIATIVISNIVRQYEHPRDYEDLAKFRSDVVPIQIIQKHADIEMKQMGHEPETL